LFSELIKAYSERIFTMYLLHKSKKLSYFKKNH